MAFQYPSQRLQDWLSQQWVMLRGRRIDPARVAWLSAPYGDVDLIADRYIERLARDEGLRVVRHSSGVGLIDSMDELLGPAAERLHSDIRGFYERTADHDLEVWSEWNPLFCAGAALVHHLYSRRLQQLNLPLKPLDTARGITSEIVKLTDPATGLTRYTVWFRLLKSSGLVIYSGIYMTTALPDGRRCAKIVFPLPRGNATVIMTPRVGERGELELISSGRRFGDPGFYFLLRDSGGRHYSQYIRTFRERIRVYVDDEGTLRTDHTLTLWNRSALRLHYKITRRVTAPPAAPAQPAIV